MKKHKLILVSAAALMAVSPIAAFNHFSNNAVVQAATYQKRTLKFSHNSYVYNKKGKRIYTFNKKTAYFKKNSKLKVSIVTRKSSHYYTFDKKGKKVYLNVISIKGKKYLNIGNGGYINVRNVSTIDNRGFYTNQNVRIKLKKDVNTVNANADQNDQILKKGTIITANGLGSLPRGGWVDSGVPVLYYRIKGSNNFISSENASLLSPVQTGNDFKNLFKNGEFIADKVQVAYPNFLSKNERNKIVRLANHNRGEHTEIKFANHDRDLVKIAYANHGNNISKVEKLNINSYITVKTPKIKNKKGYDSSATAASLKKDKILTKYAKMLDYNMRKSALVAKKTTPIYQSTSKIGVSSYFNVNNINLKKTNQNIQKGNNIGYYATLVVKINGKYYFMIQEKKTYFVQADDVRLNNFSKNSRYKKYQKQIDQLMGSTQREDFAIKATANRNTPFYTSDKWFKLTKSKNNIAKGKYVEFVDPYIIEYNGRYFVTGGAEFNSDFDPQGALLAYDVKIEKMSFYTNEKTM